MGSLTNQQLERAVDILLKAIVDEITTIHNYLDFNVNDSVSRRVLKPVLEDFINQRGET